MKLFSLILTMVLALVLASCSNLGSVRTVNGNRVEVIEDPKDFGSIAYVEYFDYETLKARERKRAELAFEEPDYSSLLPNGYILVNVKTPTIGSANTKYWRVVVKDKSGEVVKRYQGKNSIADHQTTNGVTVWVNTMVVALPEITPPFDVYVVSDLVEKRWGARVLGK